MKALPAAPACQRARRTRHAVEQEAEAGHQRQPVFRFHVQPFQDRPQARGYESRARYEQLVNGDKEAPVAPLRSEHTRQWRRRISGPKGRDALARPVRAEYDSSFLSQTQGADMIRLCARVWESR